MQNKVTFTYDRASQILFAEDDWEIKTPQDADAFFAEYERFMRTNVREKFWMVAHIDNLIIHAEVAEYYGSRSRKVVSAMLLGLARWGHDSSARMAIRTTAMKSRMPSTIYSSREEAIQAIEEMKAQASARR